MYQVVKSNTLIEQSDQDSLIEQSHEDTSFISFYTKSCVRKKGKQFGT